MPALSFPAALTDNNNTTVCWPALDRSGIEASGYSGQIPVRPLVTCTVPALYLPTGWWHSAIPGSGIPAYFQPHACNSSMQIKLCFHPASSPFSVVYWMNAREIQQLRWKALRCHPTPPGMSHLMNYFKAAGMLYDSARPERNLSRVLGTRSFIS